MVKLNNNTAIIIKAIGILLVVCLAECGEGSCLSYGHSCWGAHGKRSSNPLAPVNQGRLPQYRLFPVDKGYYLDFGNEEKRPLLDGSNDNEVFSPHRRFRDIDRSDERRDYMLGKPISSEYSDEEIAEKSPLDVIVEDSRPANKLNLLQILKDNAATYR